MPKRCLPRLALLSLLLPLVGCGYALVGQGNNIPAHVRNVYVAPLGNATARAEVDQLLTDAIAQELVTRRQFSLVASPSEADAVLDGEVLAFRTDPITFDDQGRATEYQLTVNARMRFHDRVEDRVLWANDSYVYKETYEVETSGETYFDQENLAIVEAAESFARTVVIDLLEGF